MRLTKERPKFQSAPNNLEITLTDASHPIQLVNEGYWGMGIGAGENYHLRVIIRTSSDYKGTVAAKLLSSKGDVLAETSLKVKNDNTWNDIKLHCYLLQKMPRQS